MQQFDHNQLDEIQTEAATYINQNLQPILQDVKLQKRQQENTQLTWIHMAIATVSTVLIITITIFCKSYLCTKCYVIQAMHPKSNNSCNSPERTASSEAQDPEVPRNLSEGAAYNLPGLQTA
jgi:hypothetical protein